MSVLQAVRVSEGQLPRINRVDSRRPRPPVNDLGLKHDLHILTLPIFGSDARQLIHVAGVDKEFSRSDRGASRDTRNHNHKTSRIWIHSTGHNRMNFVWSSLFAV